MAKLKPDSVNHLRPTPAPVGYTQREWDEHLHLTRQVVLGLSDGPPPPTRFHREDGALLYTMEYIDGEWRVIPPPVKPPPVVRPPSPSIPGFVYFISGGDGLVKIGWALNPTERLATLQCGSPVRLTILAATDGSRTDERRYHKRFAKYRRHGEWFERSPAVMAEIERLVAV